MPLGRTLEWDPFRSWFVTEGLKVLKGSYERVVLQRQQSPEEGGRGRGGGQQEQERQKSEEGRGGRGGGEQEEGVSLSDLFSFAAGI